MCPPMAHWMNYIQLIVDHCDSWISISHGCTRKMLLSRSGGKFCRAHNFLSSRIINKVCFWNVHPPTISLIIGHRIAINCSLHVDRLAPSTAMPLRHSSRRRLAEFTWIVASNEMTPLIIKCVHIDSNSRELLRQSQVGTSRLLLKFN